jgi:hypothetical protein
MVFATYFHSLSKKVRSSVKMRLALRLSLLFVVFCLTVPILASDTETTSSLGVTVVFARGCEIKTGRYLPPEGERKASLTDVQKRFRVPKSRKGEIEWFLPLAGGNRVMAGYEDGGILWVDFQTKRSHLFENAQYAQLSKDEKYFAYREWDPDLEEKPEDETSSTIVVRRTSKPFEILMKLPAPKYPGFFFFEDRFYAEAYDTGEPDKRKSAIYECDPVTRTIKKIASDCSLKGESESGDRMILFRSPDPTSFENRLEVVDTRNQTKVFGETLINLSRFELSPDGRYLAAESHMSRSLTGHHLVDLKKKKRLQTNFNIEGYAPFEVEGWSPDSKWMLMRYRVPDPDNTGSWVREDAYLVSMNGRNKIKIATDLDPAVCEFLPIPVEEPGNEEKTEKKEKARDSGTDCQLLFRNKEGELCAFIVEDSDGWGGRDVLLGEEVDVFCIVPPSSPSNRRN